MSQHTAFALAVVREQGYAAMIDDDGDVKVRVGTLDVYLTVNGQFVFARVYCPTSAPQNALATISRRYSQESMCGRLCWSDGGVFVIDYAHPFLDSPTNSDVLTAVNQVMAVGKAIAVLSKRLGYTI